jgi:hypothetical protein
VIQLCTVWEDICPHNSQIVLKNFIKISLIIKEFPEEILIKLAIVLKISKSIANLENFIAFVFPLKKKITNTYIPKFFLLIFRFVWKNKDASKLRRIMGSPLDALDYKNGLFIAYRSIQLICFLNINNYVNYLFHSLTFSLLYFQLVLRFLKSVETILNHIIVITVSAA